MVKFVAVYRPPADPAEFDRRYESEHMPLVRQVPGLVDCEVTKMKKNAFGGELDVYMVAELMFADMDAFKAAAKTPQWAACGQNLMEIAKDIVSCYIGETAPAQAAVSR